MSKTQKAIGKLTQTPPPKDFTWDELVALMKGFGLTVENGRGSRRGFVGTVNGTPVRFSTHEPHPSGILKVYVIRAVCDWLKERGLI